MTAARRGTRPQARQPGRRLRPWLAAQNILGRRAGSRRLTAPAAISLAVVLLAGCGMLSLAIGTTSASPVDVVRALVAFDGSEVQVVVRTARVPRTLIAIGVGASLAVAGVISQTLTRNPLAAPSVLGVNQGAAVAAVGATAVLGIGGRGELWFALAGAAVTVAVVTVLGSVGRSGLSPLKLIVAGAAIAGLLTGVTQGLLVVSEQTLDQSRRWLAGSIVGRDLGIYADVAPVLAAGLVLAFALARALTTFALGEDRARGLGQRTGLVTIGGAAAVVLLAGGAVALAGPVAFVGLAVPHLTRRLVGTDHRRLLPHAALHGAILLLVADVAARVVIRPQELPVGVMTALVGVPVFLHVARRRGLRP